MFLAFKSLLLAILHFLAPLAVFSDAIYANFSVFPVFIILYEKKEFAIISNSYGFILLCLKLAVIENVKIPCPLSRI